MSFVIVFLVWSARACILAWLASSSSSSSSFLCVLLQIISPLFCPLSILLLVTCRLFTTKILKNAYTHWSLLFSAANIIRIIIMRPFKNQQQACPNSRIPKRSLKAHTHTRIKLVTSSSGSLSKPYLPSLQYTPLTHTHFLLRHRLFVVLSTLGSSLSLSLCFCYFCCLFSSWKNLCLLTYIHTYLLTYSYLFFLVYCFILSFYFSSCFSVVCVCLCHLLAFFSSSSLFLSCFCFLLLDVVVLVVIVVVIVITTIIIIIIIMCSVWLL